MPCGVENERSPPVREEALFVAASAGMPAWASFRLLSAQTLWTCVPSSTLALPPAPQQGGEGTSPIEQSPGLNSPSPPCLQPLPFSSCCLQGLVTLVVRDLGPSGPVYVLEGTSRILFMFSPAQLPAEPIPRNPALAPAGTPSPGSPSAPTPSSQDGREKRGRLGATGSERARGGGIRRLG